MYQLYHEQLLDVSAEELWQFVSRPQNLNEITPPELYFTIISDVPDKMYEGLLVQYKVKLPVLGASDWVTEIKHITPGRQFVDEQRIGPYKFWYHQHTLQETTGGVKMTDRVTYKPPFGLIGKLANAFLIRNKLDEIFAYRRRVLNNRFNG